MNANYPVTVLNVDEDRAGRVTEAAEGGVPLHSLLWCCARSDHLDKLIAGLLFE